MFYETYRIMRKQAIYLDQKAREMIDNFKAKDMNHEEIIAAIELLANDKNGTDLHKDIVNRALAILKRQG